MRGRKPSPKAALAARGSPDAKHRNEPDFKPLGKKPPTPLDGLAAETWNVIVEERGEVFREVDGMVLAMYCELWAQHVELTQRVRREGVTIVGPRGRVMKNPVANVLKETNAALIRVAADCGLTPSTAAKLKAKPKPNPNSILRLVRAK